MPDGHYYVAVGSGFGGANNVTALPGTGTGCLAWMKANDSSLDAFSFNGCLLTNNLTTGHIDPGTVSWQDDAKGSAFFECPDVFPLGDTGKYVILASFYNWAKGGYFTNEWFVGTIATTGTDTGTDNGTNEDTGAAGGPGPPPGGMQFHVESRALLDYGQYYAARSGSEHQSPTGRRVLFSATGWHNPPGKGPTPLSNLAGSSGCVVVLMSSRTITVCLRTFL